MHIPDGYLGPPTYGALWAAMAAVWGYASRRMRRTLEASRVPLLALSASFVFVIMMFNIPIPGGTTGHATGAVLIAILIGPWESVMAVSIALIVQAVVFGDGGITALGANCFNIAFAETMAGYAVYKLIASGTKRRLIGAGAGAYVGINVAALLTAVELGVQPMLHTAPDGRPLYSPFPLTATIPAIMIGHLTVFGALEAVVTALVVSYIIKSHPEIMK